MCAAQHVANDGLSEEQTTALRHGRVDASRRYRARRLLEEQRVRQQHDLPERLSNRPQTSRGRVPARLQTVVSGLRGGSIRPTFRWMGEDLEGAQSSASAIATEALLKPRRESTASNLNGATAGLRCCPAGSPNQEANHVQASQVSVMSQRNEAKTLADQRRRRAEASRRYRARQSADARQDRLHRDRIRHRLNRSLSSPLAASAQSRSAIPASSEAFAAGNAPRPMCGWMDKGIPQLHPVSSTMKDEVLNRLRRALGASGLDDAVCAVCDTLVLRRRCHKVDISDSEQIDKMRRLLNCQDENLPPSLAAHYDCSRVFPELEHILLSDRGIDASGTVQVCDRCGDSLAKHQIPKFSIKNGFYVGRLPINLQDTTLPERFMTQLISIVAVTRVMRGGAHRAIRSHCLTFDATPGPPATLLPSRLDGTSTYRVVLAGPFTTVQQARIRKMHRIRRRLVDDTLNFYRKNNPFYADVSVDCSRLEDDQVPKGIFCELHDAEIEADEIEAEGDRVGGVADGDVTVAEDEVVERRVVFVSDDREVTTEDLPSPSGHSSEMSTAPQYLVRHSSRFSTGSKMMFARVFPHLFPYGRGHPGEERHIPVSLEACIRHYCMLSSRQFAEDDLFMLFSFDHISLQKMYTQVALKCKRNPAQFEPYSDVSEEDLMRALKEKELRRQGRTSPSRNDRSSANRLLNSIEMSGGAIWGSDAERAQCRRRAFGYQARYGQPAMFVTLTPDVTESFVMAHYTGVSSVDSLFDADLAETPGKSVLHSASLKNDMASARLFMHNMDAFIEHVLGVSPIKMKGKPFGGLFGKVDAYFGMVETQGGGTLHAHFIIWLAAAPPNSAAFKQALTTYGEQYLRDLEAFTDSVVSTAMPLDITESTCDFCGQSYTDLEPLPIPNEAFSRPKQGQDSTEAEPLLVQCGNCKTKMSSQHVLRRVLLEHRPQSWPPPRRDHTVEELEIAVALEAPSRGSMAAARRAIYRRESYLAGEQNDGSDSEGDNLRLLNKAPRRTEQGHDNLFRDDRVVRALWIMPPSLEDDRWSSRIFDFVVSMLVFVVNLHWWSHVGNCFKKSRSAASGTCRYRFPRERVPQTTFTNEGVAIERQPAYEYVNGYNAVMMATFKSNHDVQVMIGGEGALLRIYYATKYVTKRQEVVDSVTAVALAAFRRRQSREQLDEDTTCDRATTGRKRVSSLAFALSNRRKIAGPLAALYLERGSCCYMSATCSSLPLMDIINELIRCGSQTCNLVQLRQDSSGSIYRPSSVLDDYLYRPTALSNMNLYEFVMSHFRRKRSEATPATALFQFAHPLSSTHCLGTHQVDVVPVVCGVRMPYLNAESPPEMILKRSQCALVLFKPFRAATNLATEPASDASWVQAYQRWLPTRSTFVSQIMQNMDDYYNVDKQAKEAAMRSRDNLDGSDDDDAIGSHEDVAAMTDSYDVISEGSAVDDFCSMCDDGTVAMGDELPIFPTARTTGRAELPALSYQGLLETSAQTTANAFEYLSQCSSPELHDFTADEFSRWIDNTMTDEVQASEDFHLENPAEVIQLLSNALKPAGMSWVPTDSPQAQPPHVEPYSSLSEVSRVFTLNRRQHIAFTIIAKALLKTFLRQEQSALSLPGDGGGQDFRRQLRDEQLLMFLGGPGGTGKSRVIDAITAFSSCWHRGKCLVKTALTGKAATLIEARTLASFLMRIERATQDKAFSPLDLVIIDEVSMMSKREWLRLDRLLRLYKQMPDVPFGGAHIVLVGDFLQMPPVGADSLFVDPRSKRNPTIEDFDGFDLWRKITTVVVLDESMRFRDDPEWGEGCRKARLGEWTPEFIAIINERVVDPSTIEPHDAPSADVFVTPENSTRLAINNAFIAKVASRLRPGVYPLRIVANFKGTLNQLSRSDVEYVLSLPDNRFGRMAPYLDLIRGMPVQVTQNVGTTKGVANGTLDSLESVHFPTETTFHLARDGATGMIVSVPSLPPKFALLRLPRSHAVAFRAGIDAELFPVFFETEPFSKCNVSLPSTPNGDLRSLSLKIQQFPFVCAVSSTVYKIQGETLKSMVVVDWRSANNLINKPQQTY